MTRSAAGVLLLLLLLGFPLLSLLPNDVGAVRLAGVSLLWWYGGLLVPVLAGVIAVIALAAPPSSDDT